MKLRRSVALGVAVMMSTPLVPAAPAAAATAFQGSRAILVVHSPVSCMVADQYPQLEASAPPGANVKSARAYFHSALSNEFYYVEGEPVGGRWVFRLPRPNLNAGPITYYIEFQPDGRSPDHTAVVVRNAGDCEDRPVAPFAPGGPAAIFGPGGAAVAAPAGFGGVAGAAGAGAAGGVAAAGGGGISTGLLIVGGAILAGAAVAIIASRDDEPASPSR